MNHCHKVGCFDLVIVVVVVFVVGYKRISVIFYTLISITNNNNNNLPKDICQVFISHPFNQHTSINVLSCKIQAAA